MKYRRKQKQTLIFKIISVLIVFSIIVLLINAKISPVLVRCVKIEAENAASNAIDQSVTQFLKSKGITYSSVVKIEKNKNGVVTAITTDISKLNLLKSEVCNKISDIIEAQKNLEVRVPFGVIFGSEAFSGIGPVIKYHLYMVAVANCEIKNAFLSAGINQTLHRLILDIETKIYIVFPDRESVVTVNTNMCIAETVIVGLAPNGFGYLKTQ